MEAIKRTLQSSTKNEEASYISKRIRKATTHFTFEAAPIKKPAETNLIKFTYRKPKTPSVTINFASSVNSKPEKILEKGLKRLKVGLKNDFVIVYYSYEESKWKNIKSLENIDKATSYKLRIYKKPQKRLEIKKIEEFKEVKEVKQIKKAEVIDEKKVETFDDDCQKYVSENKGYLQYNQMLQQFGAYCYWQYMMLMRGCQQLV
ncbi:unnamed protein product [Blepharisma stoltei]|uniref:Uncharacterized protein n=1 Tax=Blepharisma stoltei TaxID=1481888 RepID=A0AAU9JKG8_9CILI|nr:unnamed protein product [Blepharisma stoltei]